MEDPRVRQLIDGLGLVPHPEGGFYREVFRSSLKVAPHDDRGQRDALTSIYFLLVAGTHSCWHRVASDEAWHFYEGAPLELLLASPDCSALQEIVLGPVEATDGRTFTVPAGWWQAARPAGPYALVGCTVGPGFDFRDFSFMRDDAESTCRLTAAREAWVSLL